METAPPRTECPQVKRAIMLPLSFIIFFSVLNGTMFNVAVPDIAADHRLLPSEASWVMTGYIVTFAVCSLVYGKLADIYPIRNLITLGLLLLNLGSVMGLFSTWYPLLIAARLMQASGGAAIPALAMLVATRYFPPHLRGSVLGVIASTVAFAAGIGPILGGFVSSAFHWRYLFAFTLSTVITIPVLRRLLPCGPGRKGAFDWTGAILMGGSVASILFFVTHGWWFLPLGVGLIVCFGLHIRRAGSPFVSPALFMNRPYRSTILTTLFSIGTVFGLMFMVPIMLRELNGLGSGSIGLVMFPGAMAAAFLGVLGGRLSDRKGPALVVYLGMGLLTVGFLLLSTFAGAAPWVVALTMVVCYTGFAFLQSSLPHTVSASLPPDQTGIGMGIYNFFFFVSGAFSAAGIGRLLDLEKTGFCLNPLASCPATSGIYSNISALMALMTLMAWAIFRLTFRKGGPSLPK